jgi:hypothetical protein
VREIIGALHGLTGQDFDDADLFSMNLSEDPRRQVLQRRIYGRQAQRWQAWWEENWRSFTDDIAYQMVHLTVADETVPPAPAPEAIIPKLGWPVVCGVRVEDYLDCADSLCLAWH